MPTIIDNTNTVSSDKTIQIFDNFYNTEVSVNASDYDVVFSFFRSISGNDTVAENFTASLFRISQSTGATVLELMNQLTGLDNTLEVTRVMCYFLNSNKSKTALYGLGVVPKPNQLAARNVVI